MTYDLILGPRRDDHEALVDVLRNALPRGTSLSSPVDALAVVALGAGDTDGHVAKVHRGLVAFALQHELRLHDPQAGIDVDLTKPGKHPPGWETALTPAAFAKLTKKGAYSELRASLHRVRDPNAMHEGPSLLARTLADGIAFPTTRGSDGRPLRDTIEDVASALLLRGADPLAGEEKRTGLACAIAGDWARVVSTILEGMDEATRARILASKIDHRTLRELARHHSAKRSEAVLAKLGGR
jgi:hypothetical protein